MPGEDFEIGSDGDYIDDGAGGIRRTLTAQPALRHQMLGLRGQWIGDPDAGREQIGLAGRQNTLAEADAERDRVLKALRTLETEGLITDVQIVVTRDPRGRFFLLCSSRDTQSGGTITVDSLEEFGQ
jgi:hypothetical protein